MVTNQNEIGSHELIQGQFHVMTYTRFIGHINFSLFSKSRTSRTKRKLNGKHILQIDFVPSQVITTIHQHSRSSRSEHGLHKIFRIIKHRIILCRILSLAGEIIGLALNLAFQCGIYRIISAIFIVILLKYDDRVRALIRWNNLTVPSMT